MSDELHLMIDLETMGDTSTAAIIQIGACFFNSDTGGIIDFKLIDVSLESCMKYGLTVSAHTIMWWMFQSQEARMGITEGQKYAMDLYSALFGFAQWINDHKDGYGEGEDKWFHIWSHGTFDVPILINAYKAVELMIPWHYRCPKDIRTLMYNSGVDPKNYPQVGVAHDALSDCRHQVKYVCDALKLIKIWHTD